MALTNQMKHLKAVSWRDDFPILKTRMNGQPLTYLDTASSAQKPRMVIDKMSSIMESGYSNIHRGLYKISQAISEEYEGVRFKIRTFLNIPKSHDVIFTRNTTEAINLVAHSWGRMFLKKGDEILLTELEHHANIVPWQILKDQIGVNIKYIPVTEDGCLNLDTLAHLLTKNTKLISFNHISNSLGTINNVSQIIERVRSFNPEIKILIDGSQAVVHGPVDLSQIDADFYAFTGHKLYGPSGIGCLIGRHDILEGMMPYQGGGDMIETVSFEGSTYKSSPHKFEAGTPAIIEVIGLGSAIDYLSGLGMGEIAAHEHGLLTSATHEIQHIDGIQIYGPAGDRAAIISFTANWAHTSDIAMILDQCGVAVRSGHHCCMPLMQKYGIEGTVRASFGLYNTHDDIDIFIQSMKKAKRMLS